MMNPIKMKLKRDETPVDVYQIYTEDTTPMAIVFDITQYRKSGGGWYRIKLSQLLPLDVPGNNKSILSKTEKNKIKSRIKLHYAEWECTDGCLYGDIDDAINHEKTLMEGEK